MPAKGWSEVFQGSGAAAGVSDMSDSQRLPPTAPRLPPNRTGTAPLPYGGAVSRGAVVPPSNRGAVTAGYDDAESMKGVWPSMEIKFEHDGIFGVDVDLGWEAVLGGDCRVLRGVVAVTVREALTGKVVEQVPVDYVVVVGERGVVFAFETGIVGQACAFVPWARVEGIDVWPEKPKP